ncbi:MAG: FAD-dependent oxidoreductase [Thermofilaceae archaeon]|nr:FAD-dependent oxidoreductase [Thermofilaceae archaeon]MCX8180520.1 FAD-dependent oxidoreductase [Thermofilaceae archaeon]MDW8003284.1 FAD-dependent oxidoreductase [Thermofilaceae archaeon]
MTTIAVLGGGWAGVLLSNELKRRYPAAEVVVLEKNDTPGGLLKSVKVRGHTFDTGGSHVVFSRDQVVLKSLLSLLPDNWSTNVRKSFVRLNSMFIPYPFENGLYVLPPEDRAEALISFLEAFFSLEKDWKPKNLMEWIRGFFGKWIAETYLVPYNNKIWKRPLEEIDVDWIYTPGRLPVPNWKDVARSAIGVPTVGFTEQSIFYYPTKDGIQALYNSVYEKAERIGIKFVTNCEVNSLRRTSDGYLINEKFKAEKVFNTIPLKELVHLSDAPEGVVKAAEKLDYNKVLVVGIALKRDAPDQHWIYVPDNRIIFHRYAWISNYSPYNAPQGESTLLVEITLPRGHVETHRLEEQTINQLADLGVLNEREILHVNCWLHEYGYPIHTLERSPALHEINNWLKELGIESIGRWGSWAYWNMDKVYSEVVKLVGEKS